MRTQPLYHYIFKKGVYLGGIAEGGESGIVVGLAAVHILLEKVEGLCTRINYSYPRNGCIKVFCQDSLILIIRGLHEGGE